MTSPSKHDIIKFGKENWCVYCPIDNNVGYCCDKPTNCPVCGKSLKDIEVTKYEH